MPKAQELGLKYTSSTPEAVQQLFPWWPSTVAYTPPRLMTVPQQRELLMLLLRVVGPDQGDALMSRLITDLSRKLCHEEVQMALCAVRTAYGSIKAPEPTQSRCQAV